MIQAARLNEQKLIRRVNYEYLKIKRKSINSQCIHNFGVEDN